MYKSSELGFSNRCHFNREKHLSLETEKGNNFQKSGDIKSLIKRLLYLRRVNGEITEDDKKQVFADICEGFKSYGYKTEKTMRIHAEDAYRQVMRYVLCEKRMPAFTVSKRIEMAGIEVKVSPDMLYFYKDTDGADCIEVVRLRASKPTTKQTSKKLDEGANTNLELYSFIQYGKTFVPNGRQMKVKASFYFLRKNSDKPSDGKFDLDFFETIGGGNIVSIEDTVIGGGMTCIFGCTKGCEECEDCPYPQLCQHLADRTLLDAEYLPQLEGFLKGVEKKECTKEMCDKCDFKNVCSYNLPPRPLIKREKKGKLGDQNPTKAQEELMYFRKGIGRVNAVAGAGKTQYVTFNVATGIAEGKDPANYLLLTYTNVAAEEMRQRIATACEDFGLDVDLSKLKAETFNAFGEELIKDHYEELGYPVEPRLIDKIERSKIIVSLLDREYIEGLDYRNFDISTRYCKGANAMTSDIFERIKKSGYGTGDGITLQNELGMNKRFITNSDAYEELISLFYEFDSRLRDECLYEYADQINMMFSYLRKNPYYLEDMDIRYVIVDEFQDSTPAHIDFLKELKTCKGFEYMVVVGDDAQAIYSFQGGSPDYIINFSSYIGDNVTDILLAENFRSQKNIIDFANEVNGRNKNRVEKEMVATRPAGLPVSVNGFNTKEQEYGFIVDGVKEHIENGTPVEDIAILSATKDELLQIGTLLTKSNVEWVMMAPELYIENSRVIATIDLAKAIKNPKATALYLPFLNCLYENQLMGKDTKEIEQLIDDTKQRLYGIKKLPAAIQTKAFVEMVSEIDCDDEIFQKFVQKLTFRKDLEKINEYCVDFLVYGAKDTVRREHRYAGVVLSTAHSSKGLEWNVVYNTISKYYSGDTARSGIRAIEEKRRLLFVSATRAREELYITAKYEVDGSKKGDELYNHFLKECYDIVGKEFCPKQDAVVEQQAKAMLDADQPIAV